MKKVVAKRTRKITGDVLLWRFLSEVYEAGTMINRPDRHGGSVELEYYLPFALNKLKRIIRGRIRSELRKGKK